jgi:hypothetical protein
MTFLLTLLVLFVAFPLAALALGADSRDLRDHAWEVPWHRLPR